MNKIIENYIEKIAYQKSKELNYELYCAVINNEYYKRTLFTRSVQINNGEYIFTIFQIFWIKLFYKIKSN